MSYLIILVILSTIYLITFYATVSERVTLEWQQELVAGVLDILKISVGAAIGSLTTAGGAVAQVFARKGDEEAE